MPRRSQALVRQEVKRLQRRSTEELLLSLSRQAVRSARQNTATFERARAGRFSDADLKRKGIKAYRKTADGHKVSKRFSEPATIDVTMLRGLGSALHGEVSVDNGEKLFNTLWMRIRRRVCQEWDLCNKINRADSALALRLIDFLQKGAAPSEHQLIATLVILALRMGPAWMCDCGKK
jgi:hypothetical protein